MSSKLAAFKRYAGLQGKVGRAWGGFTSDVGSSNAEYLSNLLGKSQLLLEQFVVINYERKLRSYITQLNLNLVSICSASFRALQAR